MQIDPARKGAGTHPGEERSAGEGGGAPPALAKRVPKHEPPYPAAATRGALRAGTRLCRRPPEAATLFKPWECFPKLVD